MRSVFRVAPRQPLRLVLQSRTTSYRPLSTTHQLRLKEDKPQSPEEIEDAKQKQHQSQSKREELESSSETAVRAEKDNKGPEELQKETAQKAQKEHPKAK